MKQYAFLVSVTVFLLLTLGFAQALSLEYYGIDDEIREDSTVKNTITLRFSEPISHLDYQLGFEVYNLTVDSDFQPECEVRRSNGKSTISCDFIGMTSEKNNLKLSFLAKEAVTKVGGNYRFNVNYGLSLPVNRSFVIIKLPPKGILPGEPANQSYHPSTGKIITDGKKIMVYWEKENLSPNDSLQFSVLYSLPSLLSNSLILVITGAIIVSMVAIAVFLRRTGEKETVTSVLNDDEKTIVNVLQDRKGSSPQKVLVREADFSKAKVSRLVRNLEERGVVEIQPLSGRENKIILKKA